MADLDDKTTTYDAQQLAQEISKNEDKAPKVNVEADYERSKEFDVAEIDKTEAGAKAAKSASNLGSNKAATGDPNAFRQMAKEVAPEE